MTCQQLRWYFDQLNHDVHELPAEAMRHVSHCASCRGLADKRKEVLASLRLLRESAPTMTASLDAAVLASYRQRMAIPQLISTGSRWKRPGIWRLAAAAAVAVVILAAAALVRRTASSGKSHAQQPPATEIARTSVPESPKAAQPGEHSNRRNVAKATPRRPNDPDAYSLRVTPPIRQDDSQGFRSLMYCDELSCEGGMDVVRVELPALPAGFLPAPNMPIRSVSADVLVGADGFARGIRIVH